MGFRWGDDPLPLDTEQLLRAYAAFAGWPGRATVVTPFRVDRLLLGYQRSVVETDFVLVSAEDNEVEYGPGDLVPPGQYWIVSPASQYHAMKERRKVDG